MTSAATVRPVTSRLLLCLALLFLAAGCSTPGRNNPIIREGADARLETRAQEGLLLTMARVGDRPPARFLVDTGASEIVLDAELAKVAGLSFWGEVDFPIGRQGARLGTLPILEVGPLTFHDINVAVADLSIFGAGFEERLAGILGYPFFARLVVEIDYPAGSIACFDPASYRLPRGAWQPLVLQGKRPTLPARIDGNLEGRFLLDTGSNFSVLFSPEFVRTHGLFDRRETRRRTIKNLDGPQVIRTARIAWIELGGRRIEQPIAGVMPPGMYELSLEGVDGIIGYPLLREFVLVLNYPESRIAILPR